MDGKDNPIMPRPINYLVSSAIDNTSAHQNIDTLLLQSKLDEQIKNESLYGAIYADKSPEYKGGIDPVVENIAMSPIMTLKSLGSVGKKILEKTSLRNPLYHFTSAPKASGIIKSGTIKGAERAFPGKPFKSEPIAKITYGVGIPDYVMDKFKLPDNVDPITKTIFKRKSSPAVSVTRDPKFASRQHKHIGTDVRFIMDRDEMIKKGLKIEPFAQGRYRKTRKMTPYGEEVGGGGDLASEFFDEIDKKSWIEMNPMFEFEERVRGNIPTENIKLIDLLKFPKWAMEDEVSGMALRKADFLHDILKKKIPIMMSEEARSSIKQLGGKELLTSREFEKLMKAPTYKFDPFKRRKSTP